jgi:3-oxoacyl-[acyl-carrier protein] reductase
MNERVALVTGASRGIGRSIALALAAKGWRVAVNYAGNLAAAQETAAAIADAGSDSLIVQADIGKAADRERLVAAVVTRFRRLDLLVNNAGMAPRTRMDLLSTTEESYDEVMAVNLKGPFFLTQRVANLMIDLQQAGQVTEPLIVNIGSLSAYTSSVNRGEYCISKAGMGMMTALFADRLAEYGIRVYELRPGVIATDMTRAVSARYDKLIAEGLTPMRRWGTGEDVAAAVAAIAEGYLPFSTGEVINVDGGFHLRRL